MPPEAPRPVNSSISAGFDVSDPDTSPAIAPFWISNTRSDRAVMKSRLCSTRTMETPVRSLSVFRSSTISSMIDGWIPSVGSSSKTKSGSAIRQRARASNCCSPPDRAPPSRSSSRSSLGKSRRTWCIASSSSMWWAATPIRRLSRTLRFGKIPRPCGTYPIPSWARRDARSDTRSSPSKSITPALVGTIPMMVFNRVLFPIPLCPKTPRISPSWTSRSMPCRTGTLP